MKVIYHKIESNRGSPSVSKGDVMGNIEIEGNYYNAKEYWEWRAKKYGSSYKGWRAIYLISADKQFFDYNDTIDKRTVLNFIEVQPGMNILDIGCGVGRWCMEFARRGAKVTGVDISEEMIRIAHENMKGEGLTGNLMVRSVDTIDFADNSFDLVTSMAVLMHVTDPDKFQKGCRDIVRVTKPGGQILLKEWAPPTRKEFRNFKHIIGRPYREYIEVLEREGAFLIKKRGIGLCRPLNTVYGLTADRLVSILKKRANNIDESSDNEEFTNASYPKLLKLFHLGRRLLIMISKPVELYLVPLWPFSRLSENKLMLFQKR